MINYTLMIQLHFWKVLKDQFNALTIHILQRVKTLSILMMKSQQNVFS